jgi:hypothetical protein
MPSAYSPLARQAPARAWLAPQAGQSGAEASIGFLQLTQ